MLGFDEVEKLHDAEWAAMVEEARDWPEIDVYDKNWQYVTRVVGEIAGEAEHIMNDAGLAKIPMFRSNPVAGWLVDEVAEIEDVHLVIEQSRVRWSGKVTIAQDAMDEDGLEYVRVEALHEHQHAKRVYCYPNTFFPAAVQWPKIWAWAGPARTGILTLLFLNLLRQYAPLWRLPDNPFDAQSWRSSVNPAHWPQIVDPRGLNLLQDTSPWTLFATRMGNFYDLTRPILDDTGLMLVAERWLPGDPQPFPEWLILDRPIRIWRVVDKSGVRGPTGTLIDGAIRWIASTADDYLSEITEVAPWIDPPEYMFQGFTGTIPVAPAVVWYGAQKHEIERGTGTSGITSWERTVHKALAKAIITGGKSPGWVNTGMKLIANAILGYIGLLFGNPGLTLGLLDEQVENVVLAWARSENRSRSRGMGSDPYLEHYEAADNGFGLNTFPAIRKGNWATRAYTSFRISVVNGAPYFFGFHMGLGDRVAAESGRNRLYTDQIRAAKLTWSPTEDPRWALSIGVDDAEQAPTSRLARGMEHLRAVVQSVVSSG